VLPHIMIDMLDPAKKVQAEIEKILGEVCKLDYSNASIELNIYLCGTALVYVYRSGSLLLIDVLRGEDLLDKIADYVPAQSTIIRLIERGIKEPR